LFHEATVVSLLETILYHKVNFCSRNLFCFRSYAKTRMVAKKKRIPSLCSDNDIGTLAFFIVTWIVFSKWTP